MGSRKNWIGQKVFLVGMAGLLITMSGGCFSMVPLPKSSELVSPEPIQGNSGECMCPYTSDGVCAEWVDKAISAKAGATIGKHVGAYAGQKAFEQIPFVGGLIGSAIGEGVGREIAIKASGGWEYIKKTSDLSFNSVDNLSVYLYANHSSHKHYNDALKAAWEIYPKLKKRYFVAIKNAPRK
ncbi:MAG: hypothetical protein KAS98_14120 [Deltaproteobacteria bacterium]|nr:hypothetical protein [Deltaproteobacteria bacterium]